jgi:hypothetical protein
MVVVLHRLEALLRRVLGQTREIVQRARRFDLDELRPAHAVAGEMRPVDRDAVAHRPAIEVVDRHVHHLALDVEQGVADGADGLLVQPTRGLQRLAAQPGQDLLDLQGVLADQPVQMRRDQRVQAQVAGAFIILGPADGAVAGLDAEEGLRAPAEIAVQLGVTCDLQHGTSFRLSRVSVRAVPDHGPAGAGRWPAHRGSTRRCWRSRHRPGSACIRGSAG